MRDPSDSFSTALLGIEMEVLKKFKAIGMHIAIGVIVPMILLVNAFLIPEPYSYPLMKVAIAPTKLMPFLENRELMRELTLSVFGRMMPNFAPISILFLIVFWFFVGLLTSITVKYIKERRHNATASSG